jgi:hypothetical protein
VARIINKDDEWLERLLKLIPSEIVAVYLALVGIFQLIPEETTKMIVESVIFALLFVFVWIHYRRFLGFRFKKIDPTTNAEIRDWDNIIQVLISSISFIVWVFTIGGPFLYIPWVADNMWLGAAILILWTFSTQYIAKRKD